MKHKGILLFIFVILVSVAVTGCFTGLNNSEYAFKIDDTKISIGEYKMYLYEQKKLFEQTGGEDIWETDFDGVPAEEVAKQNAINSIVLVKTAVSQADQLGIELTDSEFNSVASESNQFYDELGKETAASFGLTKDDIFEVIKEGHIQQKVFDYVTSGFEISEADFEAYFENYYDEHKKELNNVKIRYIYKKTDDETQTDKVKTEVEGIYAKILTGSDFSRLQQRYSDADQKDEVTVSEGMFEQDVEDAIYGLEQNQVSDIIQTGKGFYIIKAVEVQKTDMANLEEKIRSQYVQEKKQEIYQKQSEKWTSNPTVEKNEDVWNTIDIN